MTERYGIYWNLKCNRFSICTMKSDRTRGTVVAHADSVSLANVTSYVGEGGRVRSVTKAKEVHAWLLADLIAFDGETTEAGSALGLSPSMVGDTAADIGNDGERVRYNPHNCTSFVVGDEARPFIHANRVVGHTINGRPFIVAR